MLSFLSWALKQMDDLLPGTYGAASFFVLVGSFMVHVFFLEGVLLKSTTRDVVPFFVGSFMVVFFLERGWVFKISYQRCCFLLVLSRLEGGGGPFQKQLPEKKEARCFFSMAAWVLDRVFSV